MAGYDKSCYLRGYKISKYIYRACCGSRAKKDSQQIFTEIIFQFSTPIVRIV